MINGDEIFRKVLGIPEKEPLGPPYEDFQEIECDECGHKVSLHGDRYGCQYERGDIVFPGEGGASGSGYEIAGGPCGCMCEPCPNCGAADHEIENCPERNRRHDEAQDTPEANK
jgi:hypothetical protein